MALGWCGAKRPIVGASRRACFAPACAFVPRLLSAPFPPAFSLPSCPPRRQTLIYGRWARRGGPLCSLLLSLLSLAVSTVLIGVYSSSDRVYSSSDHGGVRDPTSCSHGPGKLQTPPLLVAPGPAPNAATPSRSSPAGQHTTRRFGAINPRSKLSAKTLTHAARYRSRLGGRSALGLGAVLPCRTKHGRILK